MILIYESNKIPYTCFSMFTCHNNGIMHPFSIVFEICILNYNFGISEIMKHTKYILKTFFF